MLFRHYIPRAPLSNFIEMLWYYDGYAQPHAKERLMPTGTTELVINLRADQIRVYDRHDTRIGHTFKGAVVCGPHSEFFVIDTDEQTSVIGVHFKPGGIFPFLKLPADELHNQHVGLDDLWDPVVTDALRTQLLEAPTPETKFRVLESALLSQMSQPASHPAVAFALSYFHDIPHLAKMADVTSKIGFSQRTFIRRFSEEVGLTPKAFCRVRRFQRVLKLIHDAHEVDWLDVSLSCGYFDQAHFIHDFRAFAGINPTTYILQKTPHLNHVPLVG
jgi:AraC-like DNA-binding protein